MFSMMDCLPHAGFKALQVDFYTRRENELEPVAGKKGQNFMACRINYSVTLMSLRTQINGLWVIY